MRQSLHRQFLISTTVLLSIASCQAWSLPKDRSIIHQTRSTDSLYQRHGTACLDLDNRSSSEKETILSLSPSSLQMNSISAGGSNDDSVPLGSKIRAFTQKNSFLLGMATAVMFAKLFPSVSLICNTILDVYLFSIAFSSGKDQN